MFDDSEVNTNIRVGKYNNTNINHSQMIKLQFLAISS